MTPATARGLVRRVGPDPDPPADADLVARFARAADPAAFAALVRRHGPMVLAACRRLLPDPADADDAFQAVFLVLVRKAGCVRPPGAVGAWLHGVAVRTAQKARVAAARRRRREMNSLANPGRPPGGATLTPGSPEHAELRAVLDEELAALPDPLRAAVVLCDLGGKTRSEAAADLGCPEGTIAARLHRARKLLADRLARRGVTAPAALAATAAAVPGDLFAAVAGFAAGGPVPPGVRALADAVARGLAAHPLSAAFTLVAAVALAGAGVLWAAGGAGPAAAPAADPARPEPVGPTYAVGYSADGSKLLFVRDGTVTVRDAATGADRFKADAEFAQFSGDGKSLFVLVKDEFRTLDAAAGRTLSTAPRQAPQESVGGRAAAVTADGSRRAEHNGWSVFLPGGPALEGQGPLNLGSRLLVFGPGVAFSPDGAKVAGTHAISADFALHGPLGVWDAATGKRLGTVAGEPNEPVQAFAWSPTGAEIAVARNGGLFVHDAATLKGTRQIPVTPGVGLTAVAWSPDGRVLAAGETVWDGENGQGGAKVVRVAVRLWDAATGKELRRIDGFADNLPVVALAFRPDGKELACAAGFRPGDGPAANFPQPAKDAVGLRLVALDPPAEHPGRVYELGYSRDGSKLVFVSGGKATVRDTATKADRFGTPAEFANFSGDGTKLFVFDRGTFRTLDAATGKELAAVERGSPAGARWAVASADGVTRVEADGLAHAYTAFPGGKRPALGGQFTAADPTDKPVPRIARGGAFSPDGTRYAAVHAADPGREHLGCVSVWKTDAAGTRLGTIARGKAFWEPARHLAWSADGTRLAVAYGDGARVYDAATLRELLRVNAGPATAVAWSADGRTLAVAGTRDVLAPGLAARVEAVRPVVGLYDAAGKELRQIDGFADNLPVTAIAFRPDGKELACGSGFLPGDEARKDLPQPAKDAVGLWLVPLDAAAAVTDLSFAPDGKAYVVVAGGKAAVRDAATDRVRWTAEAEAARFTRTPAGRDDLVALTAAGVVLRDAADGTPHGRTAPRPKSAVPWLAVRFAPDATRYAAHTGAGVRVFETTTGAEVDGLAEQHPPAGRPAPAAADVFFSPDGKKVVGLGVLVEPGNVGLAQWTVATGDRNRATGGEPRPTAAAYSPDNDTVAVGYADRIVLLADKAAGPPPADDGKPERTTLRPHRQLAPAGPVTALAFSPDGKTVAAAVRGGGGKLPAAVQLLDAATGKELRRLGGFAADAPVTALAFSPDGRTLLAGTAAGEVKHFALADPPAAPGAGFVTGLQFAPDGRTYLAVVGGEVAVKDAATDRVRWTAPATAARFDPAGKVVHAVRNPGPVLKLPAVVEPKDLPKPPDPRTIEERDAATGKVLKSSPLPEVELYPHVSAVRPNGKLLADHVGFAARLHDAGGKRVPLDPDHGHPGGVIVPPFGEDVAFSPDGTRLLAVGVHLGSSLIGTAVYDAATGKQVFASHDQLAGPPRRPSATAAAFGPDGKTLAAAFGKEVWLFRGARFEDGERLPDGGTVTALAFSPDGKRLAVGHLLPLPNPADKEPAVIGHKAEVGVYDLATRKEVRRFDGFEGVSHMGPTKLAVTALAFSPDGQTLLAGTGLPLALFAWDGKDPPKLPPGEIKRFRLAAPAPAPAPAAPVRDVSYSPDGKWYVVVVGGRALGHDASTGVAGWSAAAEAARFTADGKAVMTLGAAKAARRDPATGAVLAEFPRPKADGWHAAAFSPDGTRYAAHTGFHVRVYDTATGFEPVRLAGEPGMPGGTLVGPSVKRLAWSADGKRVAAVGVIVADGRTGVAAWDAATGDRLLATDGDGFRYGAEALAVAFGPDGKTLAAASRHDAHVWADGAKEPRREAFTGDLGAVGFLPDGRLVAAGVGRFADGKPEPEGRYERRVFAHVVDRAQPFGGISAIDTASPPRDADAPPVTAMAVSTDGKTLLVAAGGVVRLTLGPAPAAADPPDRWRQKDALSVEDGPVHALAFRPDGKELAAGTARNVLVRWTLPDVPVSRLSPDRDRSRPLPVAYSTDGRLLAYGMPGGVAVFDAATARPGAGKDAPGGLRLDLTKGVTPRALAFAPAGRVAGRPWHKVAATDGVRTTVFTWIEGGEPGSATFGPLADAPKLDDPPAGVAFAPSGEQLVFIPNAKQGERWVAQVWGGGSGAKMAALPHGDAPVSAVAWSPDGKLVATGCRKGDVVIWDATTFKELRRASFTGRGGDGVVHALAFAPDGKTLAAAVDLIDGKNVDRVVFLDPATGQRAARDLQGFPPGKLTALAFAPDGKTLAVGLRAFKVEDTKVVGESGLVRLYTTEPVASPAAKGD